MTFLLSIFGAVALLIWGTHIVTTGMMKGFGSRIRRAIGQALSSKWKAFSTGLGVTLALQSSTATGMMAAGFAGSGLLALQPGFMLMLGANVGTAVVAKVLSFPMHAFAPLLLIVGVFMPRFTKSTRSKNASEVIFGLGLMLLSLHMLVASFGGIPQSPLAQQIFAELAKQPISLIVVGAMAAWLCHSSVAVILLSVAIAGTGHFPLEAGLATVLGANLGGALGPVLEADGLTARRLPLANLIVRALGVLAGAACLPFVVAFMKNANWESAIMLVNAHLVFNVLLAIVAAPLAAPICKTLMKMLPDPALPDDPSQSRHLIAFTDTTPVHLALTAAERETLRAADLLQEQLQALPEVILSGNVDHASIVAKRGDYVTILGGTIRHHLHQIPFEKRSEEENTRMHEMEVFMLSMEHNADIIAHQIVNPLMERHQNEGALAPAEKTMLLDIVTSLILAQQLAASVFIRRDQSAARELIQEKMVTRKKEREYVQHRAQQVGPNLLNPDIDDDLRLLREMRRVMGQSCAIAYDLLEKTGGLNDRVKAE